MEMKNSVEDAFHHLTPGQESRGAATTCYAAREKKDKLSTFETAPGARRKKSIPSTHLSCRRSREKRYQGSLASEILRATSGGSRVLFPLSTTERFPVFHLNFRFVSQRLQIFS